MARFKNRPKSRDEFKDYILRRLGAPVINVEIADIQLDDIIDDTVELFNEYHADGSFRTYRKVLITQAMIDANCIIPDMMQDNTTPLTDLRTDDLGPMDSSGGYDAAYVEHDTGILVPDDIVGIARVMNIGQPGGDDWMSGRYQYMQDLSYGMSAGGPTQYTGPSSGIVGGNIAGRGTNLTDYQLSMTYMEELDHALSYAPAIRYNKVRDRVYLDTDWAALPVGCYLAFECFQAVDPDLYPDVWINKFVRDHAVASAEYQWGRNTNKYEGVKLPGDITMNGQQLLDRGREEKERLETQLIREQQADSPSIFVG